MAVAKSRVTVLIKAYPQPSKVHVETVCCAGVDAGGSWRRLYPIRFRHLTGDQAFKRWSVVEYAWHPPTQDTRKESNRVHEESIHVAGYVRKPEERAALCQNLVRGSEKEIQESGDSLGLIRPRNVRLRVKRRTQSAVNSIRDRYEAAAAQTSLLDKQLAKLQPCPYDFVFVYEDEAGRHTKSCGDWETYAAYFNLRRRYDDSEVLRHLEKTYCEDYAARGLVFALGNMAKRPRTWQLLGIFPGGDMRQTQLL